MSYAVVRMEKCQQKDVRGIQIHNLRERESKTNPDIDKSQSHLNYDIHNNQKINYTKKINEIIKAEVTEGKGLRKDSVVMCNFIVTSDKGFFDNLTESKQREFFNKAYEFFKERYGEKNIVAAEVHLDEKTPHMHLGLVPVNQKRLSAKTLFDRKELLYLQDKFPKYMQENGFDLKRGESLDQKRQHIETQKFKKMTLEKNLAQDKKTLEYIQNVLESYKSIQNTMNDIKSIEGKETAFGGKIKISKEELGKLKDYAIKGVTLQRDYEKLESRLEAREKASKQWELKWYEANTKRAEEKQQLQEENRTLEEQRNALMDLKKTVEEVLMEHNLENMIDIINKRFNQKQEQQTQHEQRQKNKSTQRTHSLER